MQQALYISLTITVIIKIFIFLHFVINELFCTSLITLPCIAKEALFEQTTLSKILQTGVSFQLLCSLSIMFPPINSLDKASGLSYIFVYIITGHAPFNWNG